MMAGLTVDYIGISRVLYLEMYWSSAVVTKIGVFKILSLRSRNYLKTLSNICPQEMRLMWNMWHCTYNPK